MALLHLPGALLSTVAAAEKSLPRMGLPLDRTNPAIDPPRIVIRDAELKIDRPVFPGERLVLTTVGIEHPNGDSPEFHPLISALIDKSTPDLPEGEWLAIWNLGQRSAGWLNHLGASIPGYTLPQKAGQGELEQLRNRLANFDAAWRDGQVRVADPYLVADHRHRRSTTNLVLFSMRRVLSWVDIAYPLQLLFRTYLIQRRDLQERQFAQAYLGLTWYRDRSTAAEGPEPLSPQAIGNLQARLLTDRHILGRWVEQAKVERFVDGYENELRDHIWGTSCYLAGAANDYNLAYEEIRRITASDVPLALGGILYYDPKLVTPARQRWSIWNPFDLTYDPFTDPEVQKAAAGGARIPLAVYVYQSNMVLRPIIALDFFRPGNPRVRSASTYWMQVGSEALSAADRLGLFTGLMKRGLIYAANRKQFTWFSDRKQSMGLEELRLSLLSHLYLEPEVAEALLTQLERTVVNPLVQPGLLQGLRAQLDYRALTADNGRLAVQAGRRVRERLAASIRTGRWGPVDGYDYEKYRRYLIKQAQVRKFERYFEASFVTSMEPEELSRAVRILVSQADGDDQVSIDMLMKLRLHLDQLPDARFYPAGNGYRQRLLDETMQAMRHLYAAMGRPGGDLEGDLTARQAALQEQEARQQAKAETRQAELFGKLLAEQRKLLENYIRSGGDLTRYAPRQIFQALEFIGDSETAASLNPQSAVLLEAQRAGLGGLLERAARQLEKPTVDTRLEWLEEQRAVCAELARSLQQNWRKELPAAAGRAAAGGGGQR